MFTFVFVSYYHSELSNQIFGTTCIDSDTRVVGIYNVEKQHEVRRHAEINKTFRSFTDD